MSERVIHTADLSRLENNINTLNDNIGVVSDQVNHVNAEVHEARATLENLIAEFQEFVRKDQLEKNVQLSETRLVKVRQELETNFGHYGDVRRRVTGILQAVDVSLVKKETIANSSEEQMLSAPRYWLAPCLIALSAWLNDNEELAEKAMREAIRRNDEKTSLFFALVTRRGARYKSSREWLDRYFGLQDPHNLEREIVILIDGFTNGIFGPDARAKTGKKISAWIDELSQKTGFVEEQHEQWKTALESRLPKLDDESYPFLRKYSPTWSGLQSSLEGAKLHKIIGEYFNDIFQKEVSPAKNIAFAVDALLDTLVSKFDEEELPLRSEERLLSLTIQENGDKSRAQQLFDNEKTTEKRVSFTQLLTNFAMHPDMSNASIATQKFSIALSKDWIKTAHDDITAENRAGIPLQVDLSINQWQGKTEDGSNEGELTGSLETYMVNRCDEALSKVKLDLKHWAALAGGVVFTFLGFGTTFLFVLAAFCFIYFYLGKKNLQTRKDSIIAEFDNLLSNSREILRACLAEVVDYRKEYKEEDENAVIVTEFLESISPEQYSFSSFDTARAVVK
ncbi:hypothetical protein MM300_06990 [Evansella sp. LMS18]|uniref:hypothetical protein n=1 Tax=Evansella sp. LMS18 TaxID=2924033 RepID=UPI0020D01EF1|nr:hypothetical protein [Evansella sp. LMS18]UTR12030.1 hypothetical protein MM300_06990 [Evansella sp. LMS18]